MKIEEIEKKAKQVDKLHWLEEIASNYRTMINRINVEKDYFIVTSIEYECRNDGERLNINPHRTIPFGFIRDGLIVAHDNIEKEIAELKRQIEE